MVDKNIPRGYTYPSWTLIDDYLVNDVVEDFLSDKTMKGNLQAAADQLAKAQTLAINSTDDRVKSMLADISSAHSIVMRLVRKLT
jgi:hypothetical protein